MTAQLDNKSRYQGTNISYTTLSTNMGQPNFGDLLPNVSNFLRFLTLLSKNPWHYCLSFLLQIPNGPLHNNFNIPFIQNVNSIRYITSQFLSQLASIPDQLLIILSDVLSANDHVISFLISYEKSYHCSLVSLLLFFLK